jgi:hypothetical protein
MSKHRPAAPVAEHPVIHLARTVAFIVGILAAIAHAPVLAAVVIGLTGYAVTLWATRRSWPQTAPQTPGRTPQR